MQVILQFLLQTSADDVEDESSNNNSSRREKRKQSLESHQEPLDLSKKLRNDDAPLDLSLPKESNKSGREAPEFTSLCSTFSYSPVRPKEVKMAPLPRDRSRTLFESLGPNPAHARRVSPVRPHIGGVPVSAVHPDGPASPPPVVNLSFSSSSSVPVSADDSPLPLPVVQCNAGLVSRRPVSSPNTTRVSPRRSSTVMTQTTITSPSGASSKVILRTPHMVSLLNKKVMKKMSLPLKVSTSKSVPMAQVKPNNSMIQTLSPTAKAVESLETNSPVTVLASASSSVSVTCASSVRVAQSIPPHSPSVPTINGTPRVSASLNPNVTTSSDVGRMSVSPPCYRRTIQLSASPAEQTVLPHSSCAGNNFKRSNVPSQDEVVDITSEDIDSSSSLVAADLLLRDHNSSPTHCARPPGRSSSPCSQSVPRISQRKKSPLLEQFLKSIPGRGQCRARASAAPVSDASSSVELQLCASASQTKHVTISDDHSSSDDPCKAGMTSKSALTNGRSDDVLCELLFSSEPKTKSSSPPPVASVSSSSSSVSQEPVPASSASSIVPTGKATSVNSCMESCELMLVSGELSLSGNNKHPVSEACNADVTPLTLKRDHQRHPLPLEKTIASLTESLSARTAQEFPDVILLDSPPSSPPRDQDEPSSKVVKSHESPRSIHNTPGPSAKKDTNPSLPSISPVNNMAGTDNFISSPQKDQDPAFLTCQVSSKKALKRSRNNFYSASAFSFEQKRAKRDFDIRKTSFFQGQFGQSLPTPVAISKRPVIFCAPKLSSSSHPPGHFCFGDKDPSGWKEALRDYKTHVLRMPSQLVHVPTKIPSRFTIPDPPPPKKRIQPFLDNSITSIKLSDSMDKVLGLPTLQRKVWVEAPKKMPSPAKKCSESPKKKALNLSPKKLRKMKAIKERKRQLKKMKRQLKKLKSLEKSGGVSVEQLEAAKAIAGSAAKAMVFNVEHFACITNLVKTLRKPGEPKKGEYQRRAESFRNMERRRSPEIALVTMTEEQAKRAVQAVLLSSEPRKECEPAEKPQPKVPPKPVPETESCVVMPSKPRQVARKSTGGVKKKMLLAGKVKQFAVLSPPESASSAAQVPIIAVSSASSSPQPETKVKETVQDVNSPAKKPRKTSMKSKQSWVKKAASSAQVSAKARASKASALARKTLHSSMSSPNKNSPSRRRLARKKGAKRHKRSLLDELANSEGYVAEKNGKLSEDLLVDPSQLSREERALQVSFGGDQVINVLQLIISMSHSCEFPLLFSLWSVCRELSCSSQKWRSSSLHPPKHLPAAVRQKERVYVLI